MVLSTLSSKIWLQVSVSHGTPRAWHPSAPPPPRLTPENLTSSWGGLHVATRSVRPPGQRLAKTLSAAKKANSDILDPRGVRKRGKLSQPFRTATKHIVKCWWRRFTCVNDFRAFSNRIKKIWWSIWCTTQNFECLHDARLSFISIQVDVPITKLKCKRYILYFIHNEIGHNNMHRLIANQIYLPSTAELQ